MVSSPELPYDSTPVPSESESEDDVAQTPDGIQVEVSDFLLSFIREHRDLYSQILRYEPLDLTTLHSAFQAKTGIKVSKKLVSSFLDKKGVGYVMPDK